jgi:hypothetical protein
MTFATFIGRMAKKYSFASVPNKLAIRQSSTRDWFSITEASALA